MAAGVELTRYIAVQLLSKSVSNTVNHLDKDTFRVKKTAIHLCYELI